MKLFADHDASGKIHSLTWFNAPAGVSLMLTPQPGHLVAEVEGHNLGNQMPSEQTLRDLARTSTISKPASAVKLSKKHK